MEKQLTIRQYLDSSSVKTRIQEVLANKAQSFTVSLLSAVNANPALAKCTPQSVVAAAMTAAAIDLPINQNLGLAYIIPYGSEAQFQIGAKGFKQLAMKSGMYKTMNDTDVREGEYLGINRVTGELEFNWVEDDDEREKLPIIGYLAYFKLTNGYEKFRYMTVAKLDAHAKKYSQTYKKGFGNWKDDFDAMARKTVIKLLLSKDGLLSTEMQTAIEADQAVLNENGAKYVDNKKITAEEAAEEKEKNRLKDFINKAETLGQLDAIEPTVNEYLDSELQESYREKRKELGGN